MHGTSNDNDQSDQQNSVVKMGGVDEERCGVHLWDFEEGLLSHVEDWNLFVGSDEG